MSNLVIRDRKTGEVVDRFDTLGMHVRQIEKLERGISINLDHATYEIATEDS